MTYYQKLARYEKVHGDLGDFMMWVDEWQGGPYTEEEVAQALQQQQARERSYAIQNGATNSFWALVVVALAVWLILTGPWFVAVPLSVFALLLLTGSVIALLQKRREPTGAR